MSRVASMKVRDLVREAERAGWVVIRQAGTHRTLERDGQRVLVAGVPQKEIGTAFLRGLRARLGLA